MNDSISAKIKTANDESLRYGYSEIVGCTAEDIAYFDSWVSEYSQVNRGLLNDYIEFTRIANGLNHNGLYIYGIKNDDDNSIYHMNETWHTTEEDDKLLFVANNDISIFCLDTRINRFHELDLGSFSFIQEYASFDEMIDEALRIALIR